MKDIPYIDELLTPEYYHEMQGFESRLAVLKLNDVRETLGDSWRSLIYSDKEEQNSIENELEKNYIRKIHIRHAIIDLNNSFDILLQAPWFFYRIWEDYNSGGKYYDPKDRHYSNIFRNSKDWVERAEQACDYKKVYNYLNQHSDISLNNIASSFNTFTNTFIFNKNKPFTIRTITNSIKHNAALKIKELQKPYNFNIELNGYEINPAKHNLKTVITKEFYNLEAGQTNILGEIKLNYTDDLYIDIKYNNGELFLGEDYVRNNKYYSLDELHKEAAAYYDSLIDLFKVVYENIDAQLSESPVMKRENITKSTSSINLDKYFKLTE